MPDAAMTMDELAAEVITEEVEAFVNWLYEHGPDPADMPREKLIRRYVQWRAVHG